MKKVSLRTAKTGQDCQCNLDPNPFQVQPGFDVCL